MEPLVFVLEHDDSGMPNFAQLRTLVMFDDNPDRLRCFERDYATWKKYRDQVDKLNAWLKRWHLSWLIRMEPLRTLHWIDDGKNDITLNVVAQNNKGEQVPMATFVNGKLQRN